MIEHTVLNKNNIGNNENYYNLSLSIFFHSASSSHYLFEPLFTGHSFSLLFFITLFLNYIHALSPPLNSLLPTGSFYSMHSLALPSSPSICLLGQRGELGTGPSAFEQPTGRGLSPQAAAGPVYRDLRPGHWQNATQPVPGGLVCSGLSTTPGATTTVCDQLPSGESQSREDTGSSCWQNPAPAPQQCHHALHSVQTQGAQWGPLSAEPSQDTHATGLPTSARRTHPRSQRAQPRDLYLSTTNNYKHSSSNTRVQNLTECLQYEEI